MASVTVFDPVTGHSKTITVEVQGTLLITVPPDADMDYYIQLSTAARKVSGAAIIPVIIEDITPDTMTEKIEAAIKSMVNYGGGANAMSFS